MISALKVFLETRLPSTSLARNFVRLLSVDVLTKALAFALIPVYLRIMPPAEFGLFGYLFNVIGVFSLIASLSLYAPQARLHYALPPERRGTLAFTLFVSLSALLLGTALLCGLTGIDKPVVKFLFQSNFDYESYRPYVLVAAILGGLSFYLNQYFLAMREVTVIQIVSIARFVLANAISLILLWRITGNHAVVRLISTAALEFVVLIPFLVRFMRRMTVKFEIRLLWRSLKISLPLTTLALLGMFTSLADRFFINRTTGLESMAVYNLALAVSSIIPIANTSLVASIAPYIYEESDRKIGLRRILKTLRSATIVYTAGGIVLIFGLWFAIASGLIAPHYAKAPLVLSILLVGQLFQAAANLFSVVILHAEGTQFALLAGMVCAIAGVGLNALFVPRYGVNGAASAFVISNVISASLYAFVAFRVVANPGPQASSHPSQGA